LVGVLTFGAFPNGAAHGNVHIPHVPEAVYVIPQNTSSLVSASGSSAAVDPRGINSGQPNGGPIKT